ncbi:MAG: hypothetical protein KAJ48_04760 [Elusimicrobiales bacterium]|nr:hypothetical protein [Elusimicrobiales bacterium]
MKAEKRFNVNIVERKTNKIVSVIGKNLSEKRAERREETGMGRINEHYFIDIVEIKNKS